MSRATRTGLSSPTSLISQPHVPFADQLIGLRDEQHKLLRHPDHSPGAPAAISHEVLVNLADDPEETHNLLDGESGRAAEMRARLEAWFEEVKSGPHVWHIPRCCIGPGTTNVVYLHAPQRQFGEVWNSGIRSHGWDAPGDGAEYRIRVDQAGSYAMEIRARSHGGAPIRLEFRVDGHAVHQASFSRESQSLASIHLPDGDHTLSIIRTDAEDGRVEGLVSVSFEPLP